MKKSLVLVERFVNIVRKVRKTNKVKEVVKEINELIESFSNLHNEDPILKLADFEKFLMSNFGPSNFQKRTHLENLRQNPNEHMVAWFRRVITNYYRSRDVDVRTIEDLVKE